MEEHTRLLEALCRICRKKKGEERKEDVAKYAEEIKQIWVVSVLVASPNVHPDLFAWNAELDAAAGTIWQARSNLRKKQNCGLHIVITVQFVNTKWLEAGPQREKE